jgi:hypothetical protein
MNRLRIATILVVLLGTTAAQADDAEDFFEKQVRPILVARCLSCHGPEKQESGLRLDSSAALLEGGDGGVVVEPGEPQQSRLIQAVLYGDEDLQMPPTGRLPQAELEALSQWVARGLPWPETATLHGNAAEHWSFQPVRRPALPHITGTDWARTPVDYFVLASLEQASLAPSPPTDRRTLLRRVTFDLTGLPPTPDEIASFENDASENAYAKVVDRLLASPRYGERWGRHWLDVARYADTKGYVFFEDQNYPWAYTYRDYVVRALNDDLPFDRFLLEQLAADQLTLDHPSRLAALGFLTVGGHFMNSTHDIIDDRIDVVFRGLMGLTVTCARCHDHKFDPIPQVDYYSLYGVFASCYEPMVPPLLDAAPGSESYRKFAEEMQAREQRLVDFVTSKHSELVNGARSRVAEYLLAAYSLQQHPPTDDFMLITDKGDLNPNMTLRWRSYLEDDGLHTEVWKPWRTLAGIPEAEFSAQAPPLLAELLSSEQAATNNPRITAALAATSLESMHDVARVYAEVLQRVDEQWRQRCNQAEQQGQPKPAALEDPADEQLRLVLYGPDAPPDAPMSLDWGFLSLFPDRDTQEEYKKLLKEVEAWTVSEGAPPRSMVLLDSAVPVEPRVFVRGNPNRPGPRVPRRFPQVVSSRITTFGSGSGRLEMAQAVVDRNNPLTWRIIANRLWLHHFGEGLVRTPGDFGLRGEPPTHPQLLDWLAAELAGLDSGGKPLETGPAHASLKSLHRLIVLSATYQQSSLDRPEAVRIDADNRLWWKFNRRAVDFEVLRDSLLAVAGALDTRLGGPAAAMFGDEFVTRRTLYGRIDRMDLPPLLATFDSATTVSPQALYMMNHPFVEQAARRLLQRPDIPPMADAGDERFESKLTARLEQMHRIVLGRAPLAEELQAAREYLGQQPSEARWVFYAQGLLMSNEFVFVD